jgi:hypothetical protein
METKNAKAVLSPYLEKVMRHTEIVEPDNAIKAMQRYAVEFARWYSGMDTGAVMNALERFEREVNPAV